MHSSPQQRSPMEKNLRKYPAFSSSHGQQGGPARKTSPRPYVFKVPKDQIHSAPHRDPCCLWLARLSGMLIFFFLLIVVGAGLVDVLYRPELPKYSLESISIDRFNLSNDHTLSSKLVVAVRAQNPNKKIGIYHGEASRLTLSYSGWEIGSGTFPIFYQGHRNTTVVQTMLTASGVPFSANVSSALNADQKNGSVPLDFEVAQPFKLKVSGLKTPRISIRVRCNLTVSGLAAKLTVRIQEQSCHWKIKP